MSFDEQRGPVEYRVVLMPMQIKVQREGDAFVAAMPAWQLPVGLIAEGCRLECAVENLANRMREHWSPSSTTTSED